MTWILKTGLWTLCMAALVGCSSGNGTPEFSRLLINAFRDGLKDTDPTAGNNTVLGLTREQVDGTPVPLVRSLVEDRNTWATLVEVTRNQEARTYFTGDEASLTYRNGILINTGAFGGDLKGLGLSAASVKDAVAAGQSQGSYRYLGALNQELRLDVTCQTEVTGAPMTLTLLERPHRLVPVRETCAGDGVAFENLYWMESGSGIVWKSTQWVSPSVGRITTEVLKREAD